MKTFVFLALFLVLSPTGSAGAETKAPLNWSPPTAGEGPRTITWDDLIPKAPPLEDPLIGLKPSQREEIDMLAAIRARIAKGEISQVDPRYEDNVELTFKLKKEGLDVEDLLLRYEKVMVEFEKRNEEVVGDLNGQFVRLPGYALPFDTDGTAVSNFLLVPYLGACIHVPPPPINQMVLVRLRQSYQAKGLFDPIWVTGRLKTERVQQSLNYVDGAGTFSSGYTLEGIKVEPYRE